MTQVKSYLYLALCWLGTAAFSAACGYLIVATLPPEASRVAAIEYGFVMAVVMTPIFGTFLWAVAIEPPVIPPVKTTGWRRYRFLMWWAGLTGVWIAGMAIRWGTFSWEHAITGVVIALLFSGMGWAVGGQRADRARSIDLSKRRVAFAERAVEAIMDVAQGDPYLGMAEINSFLGRPYNGMNFLAENGFVRQADLSYLSGLTTAAVVPETVELEGGKTVPVLVEYVMFIQLLNSFATGEWSDEPVEKVVSHIENRGKELLAAKKDAKQPA